MTRKERVAKFQRLLRRIGACRAARHYCKNLTLGEAWNRTDRYDWMIFLLCYREIPPFEGSDARTLRKQILRAFVKGSRITQWRRDELVSLAGDGWLGVRDAIFHIERTFQSERACNAFRKCVRPTLKQFEVKK